MQGFKYWHIMLTIQLHMPVEKMYGLLYWNMVSKQPIKANLEKSIILLNNKKTEKVTISDAVLTSSVEEKLLGITLHSELKFEKHITCICNKASQKIHVLFKISSYM